MTWYDIKLATLQKLFSADGDTLVNDETTRDYLAAMPQAANEALQLIVTQNIYLRKSVVLDLTSREQSTYNARYDMHDLAPDFYRVGTPEVYEVNDDDSIRPVNGFGFVAGQYIIVPNDWNGKYEIWYDAWPAPLSIDTPDEYDVPVEDCIAVILPLYMASQLYKDDDNGIATTYRNEFEVAREGLVSKMAGVTYDTWQSLDGWA